MGSISQNLTLDLKPAEFVPKTITDFLDGLTSIYHVSDKSSKLDEYIKSLEDEMRKIDAFKRELPICMLLLKDAIDYMKDRLNQCWTANSDPVLEEFIPLKKHDYNEEDDDKKDDFMDKKDWMSSAQLWSSDDSNDYNSSSKVQTKKVDEEVTHIIVKDPFEICKDKGALKQYPNFLITRVAGKKDKDILRLPAISFNYDKVDSKLTSGAHNSRTSRKQRRSWSQELHMRFVKALEQLGGSQATPKQIRELMQVEDLTNDEVKSHLQKYRLHSSNKSSSTKKPVIVLGDLLSSQDQFSESSKHSSSHTKSPQGPLQLAAINGGTSITCDYRMEDGEEDEKSD